MQHFKSYHHCRSGQVFVEASLKKNRKSDLPAWICQEPICMHAANVLEIKAATCQINSCTCMKRLNRSIYHYSWRSKGPHCEGLWRNKENDRPTCPWAKKEGVGERKKSRLVQLPEGAFVWHGHNMNAFFHIKTQEEEIHSPLL